MVVVIALEIQVNLLFDILLKPKHNLILIATTVNVPLYPPSPCWFIGMFVGEGSDVLWNKIFGFSERIPECRD